MNRSSQTQLAFTLNGANFKKILGQKKCEFFKKS